MAPLGTEIHEQHLYFAAIVGIYCAWRVKYRDSRFRSQTGPWPHLPFETRRDLQKKSGWNQCPA